MLIKIPPGGSSLSISQIISSIGKSVDLQELSEDYSFFLVKSGKDALFRAYQQLPQEEVRIPAYGCPDLVTPALKAKKRIKFIDVSPETLLPAEEVDISANLYGLVDPAEVIDDACQAALSSEKGKLIGLRGKSFGVFSAGRGKSFGAGGGGILAVKKETQLDSDFKIELAKPLTASLNLKALLYTLLETPLVFGILSSIPALGIGKTNIEHHFTSGNPSSSQGSWLAAKLYCIEATRTAFKRNTNLYLTELKNEKQLFLPVLKRNGENVLTRFPVLFKSAETRNKAFAKLYRFGASKSYPMPLDRLIDQKEQSKYTAATEVSEMILTLPTHRLVNKEKIQNISNIIKSCL